MQPVALTDWWGALARGHWNPVFPAGAWWRNPDSAVVPVGPRLRELMAGVRPLPASLALLDIPEIAAARPPVSAAKEKHRV